MTPASVIQRARQAGEAWAAEDKAERYKAQERAKAEALSTAAALARDALELGPEDRIDLTWNGEEVLLAVGGGESDVLEVQMRYLPAKRWLVMTALCPHEPELHPHVELPIRSLVDLYLALEGSRASDSCPACHPDPEPMSTWSVAVVQAGDSRGLLEALDGCPPHDVIVVPGGEHLHVISGFDA